MRPSVVWIFLALIISAYVVTLNRLPTQFGDGPFYASIARSLQHGRTGVPSILAQGPTAVDHVRFYGPVYFYSLAAWFDLVNCSSLSFRIFCLTAALLAAAAAAAVSWSLGGGANRQAWAALLVLLSPELGFAATFGRMDPFAVALEMFGLAIFVDGITYERRPWAHGLAAGALLAAAALSTPRTFPFMFGFVIAGVIVLPRATSRMRAHLSRQTLACVVTALGLWLVWTIESSGGPRAWFHMMSYIATHEDSDVALLKSGRSWMFSWWQGATPILACIGALIVAHRLRGSASYTIAATFALVTTWITFVLTWTLFENTFLFEALAILPLFAVILAVPLATTSAGRGRMAVVGLAILCFFAAVRGAKIARGVVTWSGRDPSPLTDFVRSHVPTASVVIGYDEQYFFAVEESGSRYLIASQRSDSDWAQWIPAIEGRPAPALRPLLGDFLLWPGPARADLQLPCLQATPRATYRPPPPDLERFAWAVREDPRAVYPETTLYDLKATCGTRVVD